MNRRSPRHRGVYQRCGSACPADRCREHTWSYHVELPPGSDSKRRQVTKGGFASARDAAEARAQVLAQERAGELPARGSVTVADWLTRWLTLPEVTQLRGNTVIGYRDHVRCYLIPHLGKVKLTQLRSTDVSAMLDRVRGDREAARAAAAEQNARYAAEAAALDEQRKAAGRKRVVKPKCVPMP